jgi:H+/Cl- antiporter ClcA
MLRPLMKRRLLVTAYVSTTTLLLFASVALADAENDHGEGWYGESNDLAVTYAGFILIAFFPLLALFASIAYWWTDKKREERVAAERNRRERADQRGGW